MKRTYEVASGTDRRALAEFVKREGQFLLPMVELVERTELVIDEVVQVMGRATIEAVPPAGTGTVPSVRLKPGSVGSLHAKKNSSRLLTSMSCSRSRIN